MTLKDWLAQKGSPTTAQFAELIGRTSEAVRRYAAGERIPDRETMPLVVAETGGAVTPNDFFGLATDPGTPLPFSTSSHGTDLPAPRSATSEISTLTQSSNSGSSRSSSGTPSTRTDARVAA